MPNKISQLAAICAVATPPGRSALAIVRLSGKDCEQIVKKITQQTLMPRQASYCKLKDDSGELIDRGVVILYQSPASYTGEDMAEFYCHGNPVITDLILKTLCTHGARLAEPGEFTLRAFLNDKIDLMQAEAVADVINSTSEQALRSATRSLQGTFSSHIENIHSKLIQLRTHAEAHLDFPEEEIDPKNILQIQAKLEALETNLQNLLVQAKQGERLQIGATIAIAGKPNAGKSSLLNALTQNETAIVTEIPGTTRDPLGADIHLDGAPIRLIDTAGLRDTQDIVEQEGIQRAQQVLTQADLILWMQEDSDSTIELPSFIKQEIDAAKIIYLNNKIDLSRTVAKAENNHVYLSVKTGEGLTELVHLLNTRLNTHQQNETPFSARQRHIVALQQTLTHLSEAKRCINENVELELLAEHLRSAQQALAEITGEFSADDLLGKIFSEFCIGK